MAIILYDMYGINLQNLNMESTVDFFFYFNLVFIKHLIKFVQVDENLLSF